MRATRAIIHLDNFRRNLELVCKKIGAASGICVPLKADAYGHGAVSIARTALEAGAKCFAVATVSEGAELRQAGIKARIILLSPALPEEMKEIADLDLIPLVSDRAAIGAFSDVSSLQPLELHLKIDTGMGRLGCRPERARELASVISKKRNLRLGGMATHLSVADSLDPEDIVYTRMQITRFTQAVDSVREAGIDPGQLHAGNSGALCFHEAAYFDLIRPGIFLYGYSPAADILGGLSSEPVMELRSAVVFIKKVYPGEEISYGRSWKAQEETFIGTIPIGYADGLPRLLSNRHSVLIRGRAYPLVGNICMDQCMVDLGKKGDTHVWDEAVIFGPGHETAEDMARKINTISYEILCNINKRVPRVYVG
jgi:alanine racemase